jgi:hypothetical protein
MDVDRESDADGWESTTLTVERSTIIATIVRYGEKTIRRANVCNGGAREYLRIAHAILSTYINRLECSRITRSGFSISASDEAIAWKVRSDQVIPSFVATPLTRGGYAHVAEAI